MSDLPRPPHPADTAFRHHAEHLVRLSMAPVSDARARQQALNAAERGVIEALQAGADPMSNPAVEPRVLRAYDGALSYPPDDCPPLLKYLFRTSWGPSTDLMEAFLDQEAVHTQGGEELLQCYLVHCPEMAMRWLARGTPIPKNVSNYDHAPYARALMLLHEGSRFRNHEDLAHEVWEALGRHPQAKAWQDRAQAHHPIQTLCEVLGTRPEDTERFHRWLGRVRTTLWLDTAAFKEEASYVWSRAELNGNGDWMLLQLLQEGADPNVRSSQSNPVLMQAIQARSLPLIEALLNAGADVNTSGDLGDTPLHWAAYYRMPALVSELIARGAEAQRPNVRGNPPLTYAVEHWPVQDGILEALTHQHDTLATLIAFAQAGVSAEPSRNSPVSPSSWEENWQAQHNGYQALFDALKIQEALADAPVSHPRRLRL